MARTHFFYYRTYELVKEREGDDYDVCGRRQSRALSVQSGCSLRDLQSQYGDPVTSYCENF